MRITAQLIDVADDFHFWSETWDRELASIFDVQDEISQIIADKLREHWGLADSYSFMGNTGFMPFEEAWGKPSTMPVRLRN